MLSPGAISIDPVSNRSDNFWIRFLDHETEGGDISLYDGRRGTKLGTVLLLEGDDRVGGMFDLTAEEAEQLGEALLEAADVERTREDTGTPAAVEELLER